MRYLRVLVLVLVSALPVFAQPPNRLAVVERVAAADPDRFACAHTERGCAYDYIIALVCELRQEDARWHLNGRRGDATRMSWDAINWLGFGPGRDPATGQPVTIIDVIGGAGAPGARPVWQAFTSDPTAGAAIVPASCPGSTPPPTPTPQPTPPPVDLSGLTAKVDALSAQVSRLSAQINTSHAALAADIGAVKGVADAAAHDANVGALAILDVKNWLASGLAVSLRASFIGTINGEVKARP